jgi:predicted lysophospholipase L1 biosynthesis ABC-type transport system permease subunit
MRVVAGRAFSDAEQFGSRDGSGLLVINETLARELFGSGPAVGRTVVSAYEDSRRHEIVGVVADARLINLKEAPAAAAFAPIGQMHAPTSLTFSVRGNGSTQETLRLVREVVAAEAPGLPVYEAQSLERAVAVTLSDDRFMAIVSTVFGVIGLLLAAIGLYGVASQSVTRRLRELGIRLALGARSGQAMRTVLARLAVPALTGVAAGLLASFAFSRVLRSRLFEMSPHDPVTYALAIGLLLSVCGLAAVIPASRALRVDPSTTLREE